MNENHQPCRIRRTWKRDGTGNDMGLEAALDNLAHHAKPALARPAIRKRLLDGDIVETPLAVFERKR